MKATIRSAGLVATVAARGAELVSVLDHVQHEWIWPGANPWARSAPVLFPVIGASAGGVIRLHGRNYPMPMHGFAPDMDFTLVDAAESTCTFELSASAKSKEHYPFDFSLRVSFAIDGATLRQSIEVSNPSAERLPVQLGLHPGFKVPGNPAVRPIVLFERGEAARLHRLRGGYLCEEIPSPVSGRTLTIEPTTFDDGGLLIERVESTWVWHGRPGERGVRVSFGGYPQLALWRKLTADFLCIEPWLGMPDRDGPEALLGDRRGLQHIPPGDGLKRECLLTFEELAPIDNT